MLIRLKEMKTDFNKDAAYLFDKGIKDDIYYWSELNKVNHSTAVKKNMP